MMELLRLQMRKKMTLDQDVLLIKKQRIDSKPRDAWIKYLTHFPLSFCISAILSSSSHVTKTTFSCKVQIEIKKFFKLQ